MNQEKKKEQEQRLNELVQEWFGLSTERDYARKAALYQQIMLVFFEYMDWLDVESLKKVNGTLPVRHYADMEVMGLDAFEDALEHYDPSKGMFSHYFNTILSRRKYNRCKDIMGNEGKLSYLEQQIGDGEITLADSIPDNRDTQAGFEIREKMQELMAMIINFADRHSSRENNESGRRWYRIFYTEDMTYALKEFQMELHFDHEREVLNAMNCKYLDYYMAEACRSLDEITVTELKQYQELVENGEEKDTPLPIPADVSICFLKRCERVSASRTGRSNYHSKYKKEKEQLGV